MKRHSEIFSLTIIEFVTLKDSKYVKIYSENPLNIFNKANGYSEEINRNKYSTLVPANKNKEEIKKYEEPLE